MIGRGVLVPGSVIALENCQALGGHDLALPADSVSVKIQDSAGALVRTLQLGAQKAGVIPLAWDGKTDTGALAAEGIYKFTAESVVSGNKSAASTLAFGMVNAVVPEANGARLEVGQIGKFDLSQIKQVM